MPIVETALLDPSSEEAIRGLDLHIPAEMECYQSLLSEGDEEVRHSVERLLRELGVEI